MCRESLEEIACHRSVIRCAHKCFTGPISAYHLNPVPPELHLGSGKKGGIDKERGRDSQRRGETEREKGKGEGDRERGERKREKGREKEGERGGREGGGGERR